MRDITLRHRWQGRGYLLVIKGVQEAILMGADDLLFLAKWCEEHKQVLEQESKEEADENARRLPNV
jgi:hypothetical protein